MSPLSSLKINWKDHFKEASQLAGKKILEIYNNHSSIEINIKPDNSPVTMADKMSDKFLQSFFKKITPNIPIISEESSIPAFEIRKKWPTYFCIDPLDGTKEFIKKNGEFAINIALIHNNRPFAGSIYSPVNDSFFFAQKDLGCWHENEILKMNPNKNKMDLNILSSRSHHSNKTDQFLAKISSLGYKTNLVKVGSSLKFTYLCQNKADIYLRLTPTMEWDTASGEILTSEYGLTTIDLNTLLELEYNKENPLNNYFLTAPKNIIEELCLNI